MKGQLCVRGGIYHVLSLGWKFGIYSKALRKKGLTVEINLIRRNSCQLPNKGMFSLHWLLCLQGGLFQIASCACMCFQTPSAELAVGAREAWNAIGVCIHLFPRDAGPCSFGHHKTQTWIQTYPHLRWQEFNILLNIECGQAPGTGGHIPSRHKL